MNRAEAHGGLAAADPHIRLKAARYFESHATEADVADLRAALQGEDVVWIRYALERGIRVAIDGQTRVLDNSDPAEMYPPELYRRAVADATSTLLHEINRLVGLLDLHASKEVPDWENSKVNASLGNLRGLLNAIEDLRRASGSPKYAEFDLAEWIRGTAGREAEQFDVDLEYQGPTPLVVKGDPSLLAFVLSNSVRNAAEATISANSDKKAPPILIVWGQTDTQYWVTVTDSGYGLPLGAGAVFRPGNTNKRGHFGMGLSIAKAAMESLSGTITLLPRRQSQGAILEFRWPSPLRSDARSAHRG